jgi:SAM-dependent methyltransferase
MVAIIVTTMSGRDRAEPSLREAWDKHAAEWVQWARSPELDHPFWNLNLPALLALLPGPRGLTLDVGCGEGRLARALKTRGYHVIGIDTSPGLLSAATELDPEFDVCLADACQMPFPDDHFDLAVASLSLMTMDDMRGVVGQVARVLRPGGYFCFSIVHPVNSWGDVGHVGYFEMVRYREELARDGARVTLHDTHRPLGEYFDAVADAGLLVERVLEPVPDDGYVARWPSAERWRAEPGFLHARTLLAA